MTNAELVDRLTTVEWKSPDFIDTNAIVAKYVHDEAWERLAAGDQPLTPETLASEFPDVYSEFKPTDEVPLVYIRDGKLPESIGDEPLILILLASSATGKTTVAGLYIHGLPDGEAVKIITQTTRPKRDPTETEDPVFAYYLNTEEGLMLLANENKLIEGVIQGDDYYATEIDELRRVFGLTKTAVWVGDVCGLPHIKEFAQAVGIRTFTISILSGATYKQMMESINARGNGWRNPKAKFELQETPGYPDNNPGDGVDALLLNLYSPDRPGVEASEALIKLYQVLRGFE